MKKQTKAKSISKAVKAEVFERDRGLCILCGREGQPNAHYIARSQGGLGIKENIVTLCPQCHHETDQTTKRKLNIAIIKDYLDMCYPDFDDKERVYRKGDFI